jgi:hypothetical protein
MCMRLPLHSVPTTLPLHSVPTTSLRYRYSVLTTSLRYRYTVCSLRHGFGNTVIAVLQSVPSMYWTRMSWVCCSLYLGNIYRKHMKRLFCGLVNEWVSEVMMVTPDGSDSGKIVCRYEAGDVHTLRSTLQRRWFNSKIFPRSSNYTGGGGGWWWSGPPMEDSVL